MRWALKDLKPVPSTTRYDADRKRRRHRWSICRAAKECGIHRGVWYHAMAGCRVSPETREAFKQFVESH